MKNSSLLIIGALLIVASSTFLNARAPDPPFPLDGKPVYVLDSGKWREAWLAGYTWDSRIGFRYSVTYIDNDRTEQNVRTDRIISLADARKRGVATKAYDVSDKDWAGQILNAHNRWRRQYGVPALTWSPRLADYAQQWANTLLKGNRFEHRPDLPYGENLAEASGQQLTPERVVSMWGSENQYYDHDSNSCASGKMCGHFTQVVWKGTREVGCGMARNAGREVWVCNYNPPGNVIGRKPY
jgi:uncharacterized protein YkwD